MHSLLLFTRFTCQVDSWVLFCRRIWRTHLVSAKECRDPNHLLPNPIVRKVKKMKGQRYRKLLTIWINVEQKQRSFRQLRPFYALFETPNSRKCNYACILNNFSKSSTYRKRFSGPNQNSCSMKLVAVFIFCYNWRCCMVLPTQYWLFMHGFGFAFGKQMMSLSWIEEIYTLWRHSYACHLFTNRDAGVCQKSTEN